MKKLCKVILIVVLLIAVAAAGITVHIVRAPEHALEKIFRDVRKSGGEGLYPHLTEDAKATLDDISSIADNDIFNSIMNILDKRDFRNELMSELREIEWDLKDILKGKNTAAAILSFNYKDKVTGTLEISMVREKGWKISGIKFPKIDNINL